MQPPRHLICLSVSAIRKTIESPSNNQVGRTNEKRPCEDAAPHGLLLVGFTAGSYSPVSPFLVVAQPRF